MWNLNILSLLIKALFFFFLITSNFVGFFIWISDMDVKFKSVSEGEHEEEEENMHFLKSLQVNNIYLFCWVYHILIFIFYFFHFEWSFYIKVFLGVKRIEVSASLCCWLLWNNIHGKWKEKRVSNLNLPFLLYFILLYIFFYLF